MNTKPDNIHPDQTKVEELIERSREQGDLPHIERKDPTLQALERIANSLELFVDHFLREERK